MKIEELSLKDVFLIKPEVHFDERGSFRRTFCEETMKKHGINNSCKQGNVSTNLLKGTLRGFHYQKKPDGEAKTITCISGSIYDIVVDLRKDSETFMQWTSVYLHANEGYSLHIPEECANAWITLENNTTIHYYMSDKYKPEAGRGFRFNDPRFDFYWPCEVTILSKKDKEYPDLKSEF